MPPEKRKCHVGRDGVPRMVKRKGCKRRGGFDRLAHRMPPILTERPATRAAKLRTLGLEILDPRPCSWQIAKSLLGASASLRFSSEDLSTLKLGHVSWR